MVMKIMPKSWEELFEAADKARGKPIVVDGRDLPPLKSVVPKEKIKVRA